MSFGSGGGSSSRNPKITTPTPATPADTSVIMAGLMGMRPTARTPGALSNAFGTGGNIGLARRPALQKRTAIGGM
jgi:hypothetical protein